VEVSVVYINGIGAVSPAGWGVTPLHNALAEGVSVPERVLSRPGWEEPLRVRRVPSLKTRPGWLTHSRLRRSSAVSQYAIASALEALGIDGTTSRPVSSRLGIVLCVMSGCVNYSRRFYDEVLRDPATASPLLFPETVFNAPSSHLSALLESTAINYTLVGDPGTFLQGLALGAQWLIAELVDACLVIGAEEMDWLTADAFRLFSRSVVIAEGAGALLLGTVPRDESAVALGAVTDACIFLNRPGRARAAIRVAKQLSGCSDKTILCDGLCGVKSLDWPEEQAWREWNGRRVSVKQIVGEGLVAASAWQCVAAVDAVQRGREQAALVSVVGCNQQAIGARFCVQDHSAGQAGHLRSRLSLDSRRGVM
jgi:3-oxoacyl-(acyl-carrier-protein) synthase